MGKYKDLTVDNFDSTIQEGVTLVDFWAEWCGPCRMLTPVIEELANEYENKANICKVNTDEQNEIASKFAIRSIPSILFFKDGDLVDTIIGAQPKSVFADKLNELLI
jgi:thioredoxin 1